MTRHPVLQFQRSLYCEADLHTRPTHAADQFGLNFEFVIEILQTLDQIQDTTERLKAMDSVVGAVKTHQQLKHQLQLDDVLPA